MKLDMNISKAEQKLEMMKYKKEMLAKKFEMKESMAKQKLEMLKAMSDMLNK
ncbi:MAG: hypothetical protein ACXVHP_08315 [Methanobacterium sp.]